MLLWERKERRKKKAYRCKTLRVGPLCTFRGLSWKPATETTSWLKARAEWYSSHTAGQLSISGVAWHSLLSGTRETWREGRRKGVDSRREGEKGILSGEREKERENERKREKGGGGG